MRMHAKRTDAMGNKRDKREPVARKSLFLWEVGEVIIEGRRERARNARVSHSPSTRWRQPFTRPEDISFLERANDVSSPSLLQFHNVLCNSSEGDEIEAFIPPRLRSFLILFFFLRHVVDLCQSACEISLENRVLALFLSSNFRATVAITIVTSNLDFNISRFFSESLTRRILAD